MWIDVQNYEGIYQINEQGEIRCLISGKGRNPPGTHLKAQKVTKGYLAVTLRKNGKGVMMRLHRLVALHFLPNPLKLPQINHKDKDKTNNNVENLEWCTNQQNCEHANAKNYTLQHKDGTIAHIFNMNKWLKENPQLSPRCIQNVIRGKRKSAQGWMLFKE